VSTTETFTKWLEALRSGKYKQGRGQLVLGDAYCCLGVLCEVAGAKRVDNGFEVPFQGYRQHHTTTISNYLFGELTGLPLNTNQDCMVWNDGQKLSFPEIADKLEAVARGDVET
jgi:hypothetical protein